MVPIAELIEDQSPAPPASEPQTGADLERRSNMLERLDWRLPSPTEKIDRGDTTERKRNATEANPSEGRPASVLTETTGKREIGSTGDRMFQRNPRPAEIGKQIDTQIDKHRPRRQADARRCHALKGNLQAHDGSNDDSRPRARPEEPARSRDNSTPAPRPEPRQERSAPRPTSRDKSDSRKRTQQQESNRTISNSRSSARNRDQ